MRGARWDEMDLAAAMWIIPAERMKMDREHRVPLTKDAVDLLKALPRFPVGMRFHSAPVVRLADARPMHLGHVAQADGRWRIYLFADAQGLAPGSGLVRLCGRLEREGSVLRRHIPAGADPDAVFDIRAVLQQPRQSLSMDDLPGLLWPRKGRHGLRDYEKAFCADPAAGDIFDLRGIDRKRGCMVVVRPDQYVAQVLPLGDDAALNAYFAGLLRAAG
ncbi:hypothetical protein [Paracoccus thiocyanatus]|uniref:hypothetical protein n=1 Tax=Paracoccus thiocyanatus TaxID=34006 RepID=UPI0035ABF01E